MAKKDATTIGRIIYLAAGISGLASLGWAAMNWSQFAGMGLTSNAIYAISTIGSLNWLPVGITGDKRMDLLSLIGL